MPVTFDMPSRLNLYCRKCDRQHWFEYDAARQHYASSVAGAYVEAPQSLVDDPPVLTCGHTVSPWTVAVQYAVDRAETPPKLDPPKHLVGLAEPFEPFDLSAWEWVDEWEDEARS